MTSALKNPIKSLPQTGLMAEEVMIDIKVMTWDHVNLWHSLVQPIIDATYQHWRHGVDERNVRADVGWDWAFNYALVLAHNAVRVLPTNGSGPAKAMSVIVTTERGDEIPIGMLTVVPSFQCSIGGAHGKRAFAWYLADAPTEFYTNLLGAPAVKGVARTLVDSALQSGLDVGGAGDTLLHADPNGGSKLHDFYMNRCGMTQVQVSNGAISVLRRRNTSQYFYLDAGAALTFAGKSDPRR